MKAKFYICEHCGNLVTTAGLLRRKDEGAAPQHRGSQRRKASAGGRALRQHPHRHGGCGGGLFVETENGGQLRYLAPGQAPKAVFELGGEKPVAVYAYCNLHGLWMTKL